MLKNNHIRNHKLWAYQIGDFEQVKANEYYMEFYMAMKIPGKEYTSKDKCFWVKFLNSDTTCRLSFPFRNDHHLIHKIPIVDNKNMLDDFDYMNLFMTLQDIVNVINGIYIHKLLAQKNPFFDVQSILICGKTAYTVYSENYQGPNNDIYNDFL